MGTAAGLGVAFGLVAWAAPAAASVITPTENTAGTGAAPLVVPGDFSGDGRTDIALLGATLWPSIPVATSGGDDTFHVTDTPSAAFDTMATEGNADALSGDFNGDGRTDMALLGGTGKTTIPVALSNGDGTFTESNASSPSFAGWAAAAGAKTLTGDFNGDGRTDIALVGGSGWTTIPIAFANGDGTFTVTNATSSAFAGWSTVSGVKVLTGDFNHDGRIDIALVGGSGWTTIPIAFANGDGTFTVTNAMTSAFAGWSTVSGAKVVSGDFNGDGRSDLALVGGNGWTTVPVAFADGDGTFTVTNATVSTIPAAATVSGAQPYVADYNGDGHADIALVGGIGATTMPVAFSNGDGTFGVINGNAGSFPALATTPGAKVLTGHFDDDGVAELALIGAQHNATLMISRVAGGVVQTQLDDFGDWANGDAQQLATGLTAPALNSVQQTGGSVAVAWTDESANEDDFQVFRRDPGSGMLRWLATVPTGDRPDAGGIYQFTDTVPAGTPECYEVAAAGFQTGTGYSFSSDMCTGPARLPATPASGKVVHVNLARFGPYSSVAIGADGFPVVAYVNGNTHNLEFARCSETTCDSDSTHDVDTGGSAGSFVSLRIGSDGLPVIAYQQATGSSPTNVVQKLRVAHCTDIQCDGATIESPAPEQDHTWMQETIASDGMPVIVSSLADPQSSTQNFIRITHCVDVFCNATGDAQVLATATLPATFVKNVALTANRDTGGVDVVYFDGAARHLMFTTCVDPACRMHWTNPVGASTVDGIEPSVTLGFDGLPVLSYVDQNDTDLALTHCSNVFCTSSVTTEDSTLSEAIDPIVAIGGDGLPVAVFSDLDNRSVHVEHCATLDCTTMTTHVAAAVNNSNATTDASIAVGTDGLPVITYGVTTNAQQMSIAHCGDPACTTIG